MNFYLLKNISNIQNNYKTFQNKKKSENQVKQNKNRISSSGLYKMKSVIIGSRLVLKKNSKKFKIKN